MCLRPLPDFWCIALPFSCYLWPRHNQFTGISKRRPSFKGLCKQLNLYKTWRMARLLCALQHSNYITATSSPTTNCCGFLERGDENNSKFGLLVRHSPCFCWWLSDLVFQFSCSKLVDLFQRPRVIFRAMEMMWFVLWVMNHSAIMSSPAAPGRTALVTSHCGLFHQTDVLSACVMFSASN